MYSDDPSGIYKITCVPSAKIYIGSAVGIKTRWSLHKSQLYKESHHNIYLQRAWNKYGEGNFCFEIVELCGIPELISREQYYIDTLNPDFNICRVAGSNLGTHFSGKQKTQGHRDKIAQTLSDSWIVTPPNGTPMLIKNLRKFCRENNLDRSNMQSVADGRGKSAKGWTCYHAESEIA